MDNLAARASRVSKQIADDISDRSGLGDEWDQILPDLKRHILNTWSKIIVKEFEGYKT